MTFVGAPGQLMAVTAQYPAQGGDCTCCWVHEGAYHSAPFPEACLRPVEEEVGVDALAPDKFENFVEWVASGEAVSLGQVTIVARGLGARRGIR